MVGKEENFLKLIWYIKPNHSIIPFFQYGVTDYGE